MAIESVNTARDIYTNNYCIYRYTCTYSTYIRGAHIIVNDINCWALGHISQQVRSGGLYTACANAYLYVYVFLAFQSRVVAEVNGLGSLFNSN